MGCGQCKVCQRGDENLCLTPQNVGVFSQGGYATHLLAPHPRHLFDIGHLKPEQAAPLACSGVTSFSALKKVSATLKDEPVVIIGAGGVGLMGVTLAREMGAKEVIVVDIGRPLDAAYVACWQIVLQKSQVAGLSDLGRCPT
jgi:alcohol dehydrogenase, propanol-preferring